MVKSKFIPNSCQVPNVIFDEIMSKVSHAEFKVIMAIVRKTYGWRKEKDRISISQLIALTGVSNRKIIDSIKNLSWLVKAHKGANGIIEYSLNIDGAGRVTSEVSSQVHAANAYPGSEVSSLDAVKPVHRTSEASSHTTLTTKLTKTKTTTRVEIPSWLDKQAWKDFQEFRRTIGKKMSPRAEQLTITNLTNLRANGNNPTEVLEQSIQRGWTGVFPVKSDFKKPPAGPTGEIWYK